MTKAQKIVTGFALFGLLLTGCDHPARKQQAGIYLKSLIYHRNADQIRHYSYNDQGQLITRDFMFDGKLTEAFKYQYDGDKVVRIDFFESKSYDDPALVRGEYLVIDYTMERINRTTFFPGQTAVEYEYANERIVKTLNSPGYFTLYQYDNADNIIQADVYKNGAEYWKFIFRYDNMKNPFYRVDPIHDGFSNIDLIRYMCPNNLTYQMFVNEFKDTVSVSEYVYDYDSMELPVSSHELYTSEINGYNQDTIQVLIYEYEAKM